MQAEIKDGTVRITECTPDELVKFVRSMGSDAAHHVDGADGMIQIGSGAQTEPDQRKWWMDLGHGDVDFTPLRAAGPITFGYVTDAMVGATHQ